MIQRLLIFLNCLFLFYKSYHSTQFVYTHFSAKLVDSHCKELIEERQREGSRDNHMENIEDNDDQFMTNLILCALYLLIYYRQNYT